MDKRFLSLREASEYLAMSPDYLYKLVQKREIGCYRFGRSIRFDLEGLEAWIQRNYIESEPRLDVVERIKSK